MAFYLSITLGSTLFALTAQIWQKYCCRIGGDLRQRDKACFAALAVLSLLPYCLTMGLRYGIGTDYFYTYVPTFTLAANGTYTLEPGYQLLMRLVLFFTDNPTWMFLLCACVIGCVNIWVWPLCLALSGMYAKNACGSMRLWYWPLRFSIPPCSFFFRWGC